MKYVFEYKQNEQVDETYVYSRIGMALISAQRIEFVTGKLLDHLAEFDKEVYGITSPEFLDSTQKSKKARKMLGDIFRLLKLNPQFIIEDELDEYLKNRNLLVHGFWKNYLNSKSVKQAKLAVDFCNNFGKLSDNLESFFKGFMYFLTLRLVQDKDHLDKSMKAWVKDFDFFMESLNRKKLN